ncbi:hypothetical protein NZD89_10800 [Alicyclobacillus fastidiosus]|uniref:DUF3794 domain-containing protein n=1 Tax=Alicyclobacillus fastidiosus TaxID=392011 RepID=A0ABY6ZLY5_9BACL|nr:hypothetical protein [Alicyclobacillus fastidiosus]WAH43825.1 hypothetical protein NZD89_10800 [Alicyclobacillus fastidiosus]GMA60056.1 hypothetical protein GCM10025859_04960 [Alicyclobacillus fastidiosus]
MLETVREQQKAKNQTKRQISDENAPRGSRVASDKQQANRHKPLLFQHAIQESSKVSKNRTTKNGSGINNELQTLNNDLTKHNTLSPTINVEEPTHHQQEHIGKNTITVEKKPAADTLEPISTDTLSSPIDNPALLPSSEISIPVSRMNNHVSDNIYKVHHPHVEVPVLIARDDIQVNLVKQVEIPHPAISVTDIRWSVHSLDSRFSLPRNEVFINGIFTVHIEYQGPQNDTCIISTDFDWHTVQTLKFIYPLNVPKKREFKVHTFQDQRRCLTTHREQVDPYGENPFVRLRISRIVSKEETQPEENISYVYIQAAATLSIDVLQSQLISLGGLH